MLDSWLAGVPVEASAEAVKLQQRLLAAGLLHPVLEPVDRPDVGFVVPVFNDAAGLAATLQAIRRDHDDAPIVVVDDASATQQARLIVETVIGHSAQLERHDVNRGPSAARNSGLGALPEGAAIVVFVDSDVVPDPQCVPLLLAHFAESTVVAVAPRIRASLGSSMLDRYEAAESPLDLGDTAAIVRPGSPVPYVPSTVLAARREAVADIGGFDPALRLGEDVDLIWRLVEQGGVVRYEPRAQARHRNRPTWLAAIKQRHGYGTAAAALDQRHPGNVAPVELPRNTLLAWGLVLLGGKPGVVAAGTLAAFEANSLRKRLADSVDEPTAETARMVGKGHAHAGQWLARAITRAWLPVIAGLALGSRTARRLLALSVLLPNLLSWRRDRPALNPVEYLAARFVDDVAYCSGVWRGAWNTGAWRALLPRLKPRS